MAANAVHPPLTLPLPTLSSAAESAPAAPPIVLLTRGLASGDEEAFRRFHALYFDRLHRYLLAVTRGHEQEALDALQETMLRVARRSRVFDSEELFWNWLRAVARNAARDAGRKERRYVALLERFTWRRRLDLPTAPSVEGSLGAMLEESMGALDAEDRRLVEAKYLEGETLKALSAESGLTEKAVESRLLRLRRLLRARIIKQLRRP